MNYIYNFYLIDFIGKQKDLIPFEFNQDRYIVDNNKKFSSYGSNKSIFFYNSLMSESLKKNPKSTNNIRIGNM